jgi:hypothetical protein|tara:strand:+ start:146 stop:370 length:225 start_codon:yes stop_codon:yes gene_type:complete
MDFKLEYKVDEEYKTLYNELVKFVTILVVLNLLMFLSNPSENVFMGSTYVKFMVCIMLGLVTYWLVISKIIVFD